MPTLNLVQRKKRSVEKYEDDDINNQEEEQKYLIDDDEILMNNRLSKRSQIKKFKKDAINKVEANKRKQRNNVKNIDENEEISKFFFPEPIRFLDSATPEDTKNELLIEKSLFDEKNYFENIENVSSKFKKPNETTSKATNLTNKSNDSANKSRYKKEKRISIQTKYQKLSNNSEKTSKILQKVTRHNSTFKLKPKNSTHFETNTTERVHESTTRQQNYRHGQYHEISKLETKSDPSVDWSMMIPNDSEKTIYESFYELLDTDKRDFNDAKAQNNYKEDKAGGYFKSNDQT
jgi:hypothetical protein